MLQAKKEALEEFKAWKERYKNLAPKAVACLEKDLDSTLKFMDFRYKINGYISHRRILYQDNVFVSSVSKRKLGGRSFKHFR